MLLEAANAACVWVLAAAAIYHGAALLAETLLAPGLLPVAATDALADSAYALDLALSLGNLGLAAAQAAAAGGARTAWRTTRALVRPELPLLLLQVVSSLDLALVALLLPPGLPRGLLRAVRLLIVPNLVRDWPPPPCRHLALALAAEVALLATAVQAEMPVMVVGAAVGAVVAVQALGSAGVVAPARRASAAPAAAAAVTVAEVAEDGSPLHEQSQLGNFKASLEALCERIVRAHPLCAPCAAKNPKFVPALLGSVGYRTYLPGATILAPGDHGRTILFIVRGNVEVLGAAGRLARSLGEGSSFELLVPNHCNQLTLMATESSDVFVLEAAEVTALSNRFPLFGTALMQAGRQQLRHEDTRVVSACFLRALQMCCGVAGVFFSLIALLTKLI